MPSRVWRAALAAAVILLCSSPAFAAGFTDFVDFGAPGLGPSTTGSITLFDSDLPQWLHDLTDSLGGVPAGLTITDAKLTLSFRGTDGTEAWSILGDGINLGALPVTTNLLTHDFTLPSAALAALAADGRLNIALTESTASRDGIGLYESTLSGHYELAALPPAPDPTPDPVLPDPDPEPDTSPAPGPEPTVTTPEPPMALLMTLSFLAAAVRFGLPVKSA